MYVRVYIYIRIWSICVNICMNYSYESVGSKERILGFVSCVYVCFCICVYIYLYVLKCIFSMHISISISISVFISIYVFIRICMSICIYVCKFIYMMYMCTYMYDLFEWTIWPKGSYQRCIVHICLYFYIRIYVSISICIYLCIRKYVIFLYIYV